MSKGTPYNDVSGTGEGDSSLYTERLTLIHPFFGEVERFKLLMETWKSYPREIKDKLDIIIVDDCGTPSVKSLLTPSVTKRINFNLKVYEIEDDLKHNTPGALNLGVMVALTPWVLIMDSDCTFNAAAMQQIMEYKPVEGTIYKFNRLRITDNDHWAKNQRFLPCTMLMHKNIFLDVNGFDEDFTGARSGGYAYFDNYYDWKIRKEGYNILVIREIIATEWMEDVVGPKIYRTDAELMINKKIMYGKQKTEIPNNNNIMQFAWKRVYIS